MQLNRKLRIRIGTDSSAAKGITSRLGTGKVRHLSARHLWLQDKVRNGEVEQILKIKGETNVADMQTKALEPARFHSLFGQLPFVNDPRGMSGERVVQAAHPRGMRGERVVQAAAFTLCMIGVRGEELSHDGKEGIGRILLTLGMVVMATMVMWSIVPWCLWQVTLGRQE
eukprot:3914579-Amphidinium_carterae.1